ncbi:HigA family addiction module antidote protein [Haemophilus haemoglobinophilus]|nr:HigA family addiction module antidote protein [Canicola haemoglobinophilus]
MYNPSHPGFLLKEYIEGANANISQVAQKLGITRVTLSNITNGKRAITPEMALRLSHLLPNTTASFWLNMQAQYDLWQAEQKFSFHIQPLFA